MGQNLIELSGQVAGALIKLWQEIGGWGGKVEIALGRPLLWLRDTF